MANSNENTKNPKENQEKTTDEDIQKHSEHTAENKQPESKDDVQNTDESTCLCKFFTKIKKSREARKNKNSNKTDENAAENNDAAKQAEIKQADTVEQLKEQVKLTDVLETISKLLGISAVLGTLIGGYFIYKYLIYIEQPSIFPDVITNPPFLITSTIIFGGILLSFYVRFFLCLIVGINTKPGEGWRTLKPFCYSLIFCLISFLLDYYILFPYIKDYIAFFTFIFLILALFLLSFIAGIDRLYKNKIMIFILICLAPAYVISIFFLSDSKLLLDSVHFVRFAEIREDSSWYLLHNNFQQNSGSQETNGIDKNDLLKLKQKFKCSALSEEVRKKRKITCSPETRNNALFGYMAWNLGDTKVFCPPTVDNTLTVDDTKTEKEQQIEREIKKDQLGKECIIISGKALQIMPESYISTNTDGIDDGNPENTGHDDPAIDINTDVRFKNDLNAQSNAGLNNFNVQPVLPIQSSAKNMSIQINYGSCNHDSPRNKDGHPDIGYTDKKICQ